MKTRRLISSLIVDIDALVHANGSRLPLQRRDPILNELILRRTHPNRTMHSNR